MECVHREWRAEEGGCKRNLLPWTSSSHGQLLARPVPRLREASGIVMVPSLMFVSIRARNGATTTYLLLVLSTNLSLRLSISLPIRFNPSGRRSISPPISLSVHLPVSPAPTGLLFLCPFIFLSFSRSPFLSSYSSILNYFPISWSTFLLIGLFVYSTNNLAQLTKPAIYLTTCQPVCPHHRKFIPS